MSKLLKMGVHACGTVKTSRKGLPKMMKENSKLARGEFQFETKGAISAVKWMDNRPVTFLFLFSRPEGNNGGEEKKQGWHKYRDFLS
jgi:hypothetical protein